LVPDQPGGNPPVTTVSNVTVWAEATNADRHAAIGRALSRFQGVQGREFGVNERVEALAAAAGAAELLAEALGVGLGFGVGLAGARDGASLAGDERTIAKSA